MFSCQSSAAVVSLGTGQLVNIAYKQQHGEPFNFLKSRSKMGLYAWISVSPENLGLRRTFLSNSETSDTTFY